MGKLIQQFPFLEKITIVNSSAQIVLVAVAVPNLISYFRDHHEYRWVALGLYFIFGFLLSIRGQVTQHSQIPPALYLAIQTIIIISLLALPPHHQFVIILFFILSVEAPMLQPVRGIYWWVFIFISITTIFFMFFAGAEAAFYNLPIYAGGYIFFAVFAFSAAKAERARTESQALLQDLRSAHHKLQSYAAQAEDLAVAEERNRMAREMHDTLGHRLTVAIVQLEGAQRLVAEDPERTADMVATVREQMRSALGELRSTVATLRKPLAADFSLTSALKRLGNDFQNATEIDVQMIFAYNLPSFSDSYRMALYRAAQEALTNIQRHANADKVSIRLVLDEIEGVRLSVSDNGIGLPENADNLGFGLLGIQERAELLGGQMRLETNPEGGAKIFLCLPWPLESDYA
ncbi:MAG: sensor histidine kinase [Anaerolineae bacterium]|nr:sensor histidine kinase [Anaerolineae bacterium]